MSGYGQPEDVIGLFTLSKITRDQSVSNGNAREDAIGLRGKLCIGRTTNEIGCAKIRQQEIHSTAFRTFTSCKYGTVYYHTEKSMQDLYSGMVTNDLPFHLASEEGLHPKGIERLRRLRNSATELFLEHGYEATSMDMLIQKVGGSRRNIYERFGGKEGLFSVVIAEECKKLAGPLESLTLEDGCVRQTLEKFGEEILRIIKKPRVIELHRLMIAEGKRFPRLSRTIWSAGHHNAKSVLAAWIQRQQEQAKLRPELEASGLAYAFIHMVTGEAQLQLLSGGPCTTEEQDSSAVALAVSLFLAAAQEMDHA
ncbi:TetR/AcrR family transcriptional regulator [Gluconobacter wancherniae]|uniref:TetR/AcrR family transcriptional regulator n=1 Tax=Gluconobacter wancherniae TaxID=1307955 RepID=UPI0030A1C707